jgi:hypothetical protein
MRLWVFIVLFVCTAANSLQAQVPGYMGKRVHLQGGIKFFPSFGFPVNVQQAYPVPIIVPGMNYRLELGMDFMVSRKSSIGFNTHYYNTAFFTYSGSAYDSRVSVEGGSIGAVFKTHFGGWVAPLGFYYRLEAGAMINSTYDAANNFGGGYNPTTSGMAYINNAFGRTHIFANRVSLDYGAELGLVLPPIPLGGGVSNYRMFFHNLVNFYIKIGGIF